MNHGPCVMAILRKGKAHNYLLMASFVFMIGMAHWPFHKLCFIIDT